MAFGKGKVGLEEVFGIFPSVPKHTYVDRNKLDKRFKNMLKSGNHIVIHGTSKQGKTVLRRKNLPEAECITVQCSLRATLSSIYAEILRQSGTGIPTEVKEQLSGMAAAKGGIPKVFEGHGKFESSTAVSFEPQGSTLENINFIAEAIKQSRKTLVIEDFHYLPEDERKSLAFDLKALWDFSIQIVIVGVWQEENLLSYYNGDLSGRIEEIDLKWTDAELEEVLKKGASKLNILFSDSIKKKIIQDSNGNVGLLQRITKRLCAHSGITQTAPYGNPHIIRNVNALASCRLKECQLSRRRYREFSDLVSRGFSNNTARAVYAGVLRVCLEATDDELKDGLYKDVIKERVTTLLRRPVAKQSLDNVLNNLVKLQIERKISPVVLSYNDDSRKIKLVDQELLFFRKYIGEDHLPWPWLQNHDATEA